MIRAVVVLVLTLFSGVATKYLARPEAATVGLYGTGKQARTQLLAVCKVRTIKHVSVFSRNEDNRRAFCAEMAPLCRCPVEPASRTCSTHSPRFARAKAAFAAWSLLSSCASAATKYVDRGCRL